MNAGPLWVTKIEDLVREAVDQVPDQGQQTRRLAQVHPAPDLGPGWFVVHTRLSAAQAEHVADGYLRHGTEGAGRGYDVLEVVVSGEEVRVRASAAAPRTTLHLFVPAGDQRLVLTGLAEGLAAVRESPLLIAFAQKQLTPIPVSDELASIPGWDQLRPAQQEAVAACCGAGLQVVWGPPRTGKTRVVTAALSHLASTGRRVLLVSSTDLAVDTAVHQAVRGIRPRSGEVLRVGTIHLPALAADERVNLQRLTELRQSELHQQAAMLEARIDGLTVAETELDSARAQIADFDAAGYQRARQRVANRAAQERQQHDLGSAEEDVTEAQTDQLKYQTLMLSLAAREAMARETHARTRLVATETELATLNRHVWRRIRRFRAVRRVRAARRELIDELARATAALDTAQELARKAGTNPEACRDRSRPGIEAGRDAATGRLKAAQTRLADIHLELGRLNLLDLGNPADQSQVTGQWPLWRLHTDLPALVGRAEQEQRQRYPLEREHDRMQEQITRDRRATEQSLVNEAQMVATTLTQLALRPWITHEPFDHVLIEEAAAAAFPHLVHAVGRARVGAVLIGDHLQNGPWTDADFPGSGQVKALFTTNCFAFLGVRKPAETKPGCVVLTEQFQVRPAFTDLANRVAYDNVLASADQGTAGQRTADIVVLTVDGLPRALRTVHHPEQKESGWWAIGTLLARALAEEQGSGSNQAFGVVVPYQPQVDATRAALAEAGGDRDLTPVGTGQSFQGRQFDTVLADLVEDGEGWMTGARLDDDGRAFDGIRHFTVAATRARSRLYLLLTDRALQNADAGPLPVLREMIAEGAAHHLDIAELLGLSENKLPVAASPEADLLAALKPYVRTVRPRDEDAVVEDIVTQITKAMTSVWCWSTWVGKYAVAITEALEQAHLRGVDVHLLAQPLDQVPPGSQWSLAGLAERLPQLVFIRDMDQNIVVIDRQWSLVGNRNSFSPNDSPGFLVTMESAAFAEQLLVQEMADELAAHRRCRQCDEPLRECREALKEPKRRWTWLCPNNHPTPFPDGQKRTASRAHHRWASPGWTQSS
ncbi:MAG TPA: AAA domain-containing protein [Kineosporiaceae bacterium]|nr:AAA domain-containing protein [Kineosporiaceae bacterium]